MIKLLRYLKKRDWFLIVIILALAFLQVYCMMTLTDYIKGITQAITFLDYHNQGPLNFFLSFANGNAEMETTIKAALSGFTSWDQFSPEMINNIAGMVTAQGQDPAAVTSMLLSIRNATTGDIWWNAGMMILTATGMIAVQALISVIAAYIASRLATSLRNALNTQISSFSLAEINRFSTASLVTRATNDVQQVQFAILLSFRMFFQAPITAVWAILKINAVSWQLMLPTIIGVCLLIFGMFLLLVFVMPKFKVMQKLIDKLNGITRENLSGIRVVHAYNAEEYQEDKFALANRNLTKTQLFTGNAMSVMMPYITIIMNGISIAVYWIGASLINQPTETLTYSQLLSFMMLSTQIVMAFMMLLMMFYMLPRASVCAKRIQEVLDTKPSILDPEEEKERTEKGTITFKDVSFAYPGADNDVVEHISFSAKQGETIAFIGATGSGKTTIVNLADRLYDVKSGEVLVDGVNVKDLKQSTLHSLISYVPQKGLLFKGTVKSNIAFGNTSLSMEEVKKAAQIAEADSFINEMDQGYDASIAQGGSNVSGGQRQRLCIARAVAMNPEFIIFDDSFSALDFKTDRKVRDNLKENEKDVTKLIVAQRIGTIMDADHIVVLNEGKMVGYGTHEELLKSCDTYREIAFSQLSKEELGL